METKRIALAHLSALITILIWGTTFISTKVLLRTYSPIEILFIRFLIGYGALAATSIILGKGFSRFTFHSFKQELMLLGAGIFGVTLYFLLENIALTYTNASNVGVIVAISPFFTAMLCMIGSGRRAPLANPSGIALVASPPPDTVSEEASAIVRNGEQQEHPTVRFFLGFLASFVGIALLSFGESRAMRINPLGDLLAMAAAFAWAMYSVLLKKISTFIADPITMTRRIFFYGLVCMLPALRPLGFSPDLSQLARPEVLFNILFLGLGASALCFSTWNRAVGILGALTTSVYIYLVPVVTVIFSVIILHEPLTIWLMFGTVLTITGLGLAQKKTDRKVD